MIKKQLFLFVTITLFSVIGLLATPVFEINVTEFDFEDWLMPGWVSNFYPDITNAGTSNLIIEEIFVTGPNADEFEIILFSFYFGGQLPMILEPGQTLVEAFGLQYTVESTGIIEATLHIVHNAEGSPFTGPITAMIFSGPPEFEYGPDWIVFDTVCISFYATHTFTLRNVGCGVIEIDQIYFEMFDGSDDNFILDESIQDQLPIKLFADEEFQFTFTISPVEVGYNFGFLWIYEALGVYGVWIEGDVIDAQVKDFPHLEDFDDPCGLIGLPVGWTRWIGELSETSDISPDYGWFWEFINEDVWTSMVPFGNDWTNYSDLGLSIDLWGGHSDQHKWVETSAFILGSSVGHYNLSLDFTKTEWGSTEPGVSAADDMVAILYSVLVDGKWTPYSIDRALVVWDNQGTDRVLSEVDNTRQSLTVPLPISEGHIKLAFYGRSPEADGLLGTSIVRGSRSDMGDFVFFIDNLKIEHAENGGGLNVTLSNFTSTINVNNTVSLNWTTASENNMSGFVVLRSDLNDRNSSMAISSLITATNTSTISRYEFNDTDVVLGNTYYYWIEMIGNDRSSLYSQMLSVNIPIDEVPNFPEVTFVSSAYPNPLRIGNIAHFDVEVKENEIAIMQIFNVRGQLVQQFSDIHPGRTTIKWNGRDSNDREVASGVYFYRLTSPSTYSVRRMMIIK